MFRAINKTTVGYQLNMAEQDSLFNGFRNNAELVAAKVSKIKSVYEAIDYLSVLVKKETSRPVIIAAPEFSESELDELLRKVPDTKIIEKDLYTYQAGISFALTTADFGSSPPV